MALMTNVRIRSCKETGGRAAVIATIEGKEKVVVTYYDDELTFTPSEFEGKEESYADELFHHKDIAYLQS